jgi:hypothetical protein
MDLTSISAALGSVKAALEIAKLLKDSTSTLEQAEVKLKMADLISALADVKIEIADVRDVLAEKDQLIKELKQQLNIKSKVVWEKPYYWLMNDDVKEGPFCQNCYDDSKKMIRLQGGGTNAWRCYSCEKYFEDANYRIPALFTSRY